MNLARKKLFSALCAFLLALFISGLSSPSLSFAAENFNGACGAAPKTCSVGTVTGIQDNGYVTSWTCNGSGNGINAWCSVRNVINSVNGVCGTAVKTCSSGTATGIQEDSYNTSWTCTGSGEGTNAWCSVRKTVNSVNGVCGAAGKTCSVGSVTGIRDDGYNTSWTCTGSGEGINAWCIVSNSDISKAVNGTCGASNGLTLSTAPTTNLCSVGAASSVGGTGPWAWSCVGTNGGATANCTASLKAAAVNGTCGTSNGVSVSTAPTTNLCSAGTASNVGGAGPWAWSCAGTNGGATANCTAPLKAAAVNGTCGTSNGLTVSTAPTTNLCNAGTASSVGGNGPWTWSCVGANGGTTASCTAAAIVKPSVSASGTTIPSATQIVDTSGAVWTVSGGVIYKNGGTAGYSANVTQLLYMNGVIYQQNAAKSWWSWNGGGWVDAASPVGTPVTPINGVCGTSNGVNVSTAPTTNLCNAGTSSSVGGTGPWTWSCAGTNGGATASCTAPLKAAAAVNGTCGTTRGTCSAGVVASLLDDGTKTTWACTGSNGGTSASCNIMNPINAVCGTKINTCSAGAVGSIGNDGTNATWTCAGSFGGTSTLCSVPLAVNGVCGTTAGVCLAGTASTIVNNGQNTTWSCVGGAGGATATCNAVNVNSSALTSSKVGVNLNWINDWFDRQMMFVDVIKNARSFASVDKPHDPASYPVPVDSAGWPTTDFGVYILSNPADPLNRPLAQTFPSMFGTYSLSFVGQANVRGSGCCKIENLNYNAVTNTTTAKVVVGPSDEHVALIFENTNGGVKNLQLLRPGYPLGTTQVFTTQFLNAIAPFSTLRFMDPLQTNNNPITSWSQRTLPTKPQQSGPEGLAWEYVIQLANTTGKDIWINIPTSVDLTDTSANNYVTRLAQLMKATLNPNVHVYVEYSNELWNYFTFYHPADNYSAAVEEVSSGKDPTLAYDGDKNPYMWAARRVVHQTIRISQLFRAVYGDAAMNNIIRPVYATQFVQPTMAMDGLLYLKKNFGSPNQFLYAVAGAPYIQFGHAYSDLTSLFDSLRAGMPEIMSLFPGQTYNGNVVYSGISLKALADYYGLKSLTYEGGPDLAYGDYAGHDFVLKELALNDDRVGEVIRDEISNWLGCKNDLFMFYSFATTPSDPWGLYQDLTIPTAKSRAINALMQTPLSSHTSCSSH